ncbi:MAG: hypothetical protein L6R00_06520 [Phycisphaerae bacterium]|nr:hypothetical protein [Phycisphaerae bacterium]
MSSAITAAQRRLLFRLAAMRGLDLDALRDLTPAGSVSALTIVQAAALIDRLSPAAAERQDEGGPPPRPRPPRQRPGTIRLATAPQRRHIAWLRDTLGWDEPHLENFLRGRTFPDGRPMHEYRTADDARRVIRLLLGVQANRRRAAAPTGDIAP